MRVSLNEGGLHDLVGTRVIAEPVIHQRMNRPLVTLDERLEAIVTPGDGAGDELRVVHAACTSM
ncbi:MAG TPA: hypothetical protein VJ829_16470 [Candidatus Binatia bacterium]|nr:hypothetical protein [Candidatus Binatia bacterium]